MSAVTKNPSTWVRSEHASGGLATYCCPCGPHRRATVAGLGWLAGPSGPLRMQKKPLRAWTSDVNAVLVLLRIATDGRASARVRGSAYLALRPQNFGR